MISESPARPRSVSLALAAAAATRKRLWPHNRIGTISTMTLLGVTIALHAALFLVIFPNTPEDVVLRGFLRLTYYDASRVVYGAVPYRDFLLEYPPGSLLVMLVPRLFAVGTLDYRQLFFAEIAALDVTVVIALYCIARTARLPAWRVLAFYTLYIVCIGPLAAYRLDLASAAMTTLAVLAWLRDRPALAAMAIAAGTATKIYPLALLPLLAMELWWKGQLRRLWISGMAFTAMFIAWVGPVLWPVLQSGTSGLNQALRFQTDRHLQVESIWATPPLLLHMLSGFPLDVVGRNRALVVLGPGDAWGNAGGPAMLVAGLVIYWCWWCARHHANLRAELVLLTSGTLMIAAAILSKVLSPQYLLWAMPGLATLPARPRLAMAGAALFVVALPVTQWVYPIHYGELVVWLTRQTIVVLAVRNGLLILALSCLLLALWQATRPFSQLKRRS
jgi:hypothetical protein